MSYEHKSAEEGPSKKHDSLEKPMIAGPNIELLRLYWTKEIEGLMDELIKALQPLYLLQQEAGRIDRVVLHSKGPSTTSKKIQDTVHNLKNKINEINVNLEVDKILSFSERDGFSYMQNLKSLVKDLNNDIRSEANEIRKTIGRKKKSLTPADQTRLADMEVIERTASPISSPVRSTTPSYSERFSDGSGAASGSSTDIDSDRETPICFSPVSAFSFFNPPRERDPLSIKIEDPTTLEKIKTLYQETIQFLQKHAYIKPYGEKGQVLNLL